MEHENQQLRNRVSALQADLETSEAVQRDFVQLSQQLQVVAVCVLYSKQIKVENILSQVQLEKIRQSEKELRWQYEEDIDQCAECRQSFGVAKRKVTTTTTKFFRNVQLTCSFFIVSIIAVTAARSFVAIACVKLSQVDRTRGNPESVTYAFIFWYKRVLLFLAQSPSHLTDDHNMPIL